MQHQSGIEETAARIGSVCKSVWRIGLFFFLFLFFSLMYGNILSMSLVPLFRLYILDNTKMSVRSRNVLVPYGIDFPR